MFAGRQKASDPVGQPSPGRKEGCSPAASDVVLQPLLRSGPWHRCARCPGSQFWSRSDVLGRSAAKAGGKDPLNQFCVLEGLTKRSGFCCIVFHFCLNMLFFPRRPHRSVLLCCSVQLLSHDA